MCVHIVVTAPDGYDLDADPSVERHEMYLDPFGTDGEVPLERLEQLVSHADMNMEHLRGTGTVFAITARTAHNIEASYAAGARRIDPLSISQLLHGNAAMNRQLALYATHWALLILQEPFSRVWAERRMHLLRKILREWPEDEWIMSKYVLTQGQRIGTDVAMQHMEVFVMNSSSRSQNQPPDPFQSELTAEKVAPFQLGQVFIHRRYQWIGAIVGFYEVPPASWGSFDAAAEGDGAGPGADGKRRFYVKTM